jgi:hypothetical protein
MWPQSSALKNKPRRNQQEAGSKQSNPLAKGSDLYRKAGGICKTAHQFPLDCTQQSEPV